MRFLIIRKINAPRNFSAAYFKTLDAHMLSVFFVYSQCYAFVMGYDGELFSKKLPSCILYTPHAHSADLIQRVTPIDLDLIKKI